MRDPAGDAVLPVHSAESASGTSLFAVRRRFLAVVPAALLLVLGLGYWAYSSVERSQKEQRRDELHALLRASVQGVTTWLSAQERLATAVAADPGVIAAAVSLVAEERDGNAGALAGHPAHDILQRELSLLMSGTHFEQYLLVRRDGVVVASSLPTELGLQALVTPKPGPVFETLERAKVWPPHETRSGHVRAAVSSPIRAKGAPVSTLFLLYNPSLEFSRILSAARSGTSGETYAFDRAGRLVSQSRFDDALRAIGLVRMDAKSSVLSLTLRDPGVDLTPGGTKPLAGPRPFTVAVQSALAERRAGFDVDGYRDYRGVPVIGAWTWLENYEMGIVTEKDAAEAFGLRDTVRRALALVFAALVSALFGVLALSHLATLLDRRTKKAEARVQRLGQYQLTRKLGEGGMGTVYVAHHTLLRRPTAIKLLRPSAGTDRLAIARFEREVRMTSQLTHPNTIAVYDYGVTPDGTFYYAMELLDGIDLADLVARSGALPASRVIHLLLQACGSLSEAHQAGLIHRDIKPANLIVCTRGGIRDTLKVLDFGLVKRTNPDEPKITAVDVVVGTPAFLAPEVLTDADHTTPSTDIYALGATAYYLLTARAVFEKRGALQILAAQVNEAPVPPSVHVEDVPADLEAVVMRCLAKDPKERFASMEELAEALRACAAYGSWTQADARTFWSLHRDEKSKPRSDPHERPAARDTMNVDLDDARRGIS